MPWGWDLKNDTLFSDSSLFGCCPLLWLWAGVAVTASFSLTLLSTRVIVKSWSLLLALSLGPGAGKGLEGTGRCFPPVLHWPLGAQLIWHWDRVSCLLVLLSSPSSFISLKGKRCNPGMLACHNSTFPNLPLNDAVKILSFNPNNNTRAWAVFTPFYIW